MQTSVQWAKTVSSPLPETKPPMVSRRLVARLQSIRVLKRPADFATLLIVTTAYWFVSAWVCQLVLFPLVRSVHSLESLKAIFLILSVIGVFVIFNEPAHALFAGGTRILKYAATVLLAAWFLIAVAYWLSAPIFAVLFAMATEQPIHVLPFIVSNSLLMAANAILPALGGAYLVRLLRHVLRRQKIS